MGGAGWPCLLLCSHEGCLLHAHLLWARVRVLRGTCAQRLLSRSLGFGLAHVFSVPGAYSLVVTQLFAERGCDSAGISLLNPLQLVYAKGSATHPHVTYRECHSGGATLTCQINHLNFSLPLVKGQESLQGPEIN